MKTNFKNATADIPFKAIKRQCHGMLPLPLL